MKSMDATGDYEALTLIEGCLVIQPLDIWPGLGIFPVDDSRHRVGIAAVMDDVLATNDWGVRVGTSTWLDREAGNLPLALVQYIIPASTSTEAILFSRVLVDLVIDALALRRGAAATPLVTVMRRRGGDRVEAPFVVESGARQYGGNLLGGVLSGESVDDLSKLLNSAGDPLVRLWLGARRGIATERDSMFCIHRWWNLVEAIATAKGAPVEQVNDFDGTAILHPGSGRPFRTSAKVGLVFAHARNALVARHVSNTSFVAHSNNLWDFVVAWYGFRNAVAHHGTFDPTNQALHQWWWFDETRRAHEWDKQRLDGFPFEVRQLGDLLVEWEIEGRSDDKRRPGAEADNS
jgi:hypothetical protein